MLQTGWEVLIRTIIRSLIHTVGKLFLTVVIALLATMAQALPVKNDSLRFEVLLTGKMLKDIHVDENLISSIEITSNRLILLSSTDQFYVLGWGGIVPYGNKKTGKIGSFAYTSDSLLMTIRNNELCSFDSSGNLSKLFKLPNEGMGISPGKHVMYVYDRTTGKTKNALYIIAKGGQYTKLFELPSPIRSVGEMNHSILFASKNGVFSYNPQNKNLKVVAVVPKENEIKSIAVDSLSMRIYFSTENAVYAIKDSSMITITEETGGILRFFNDGLIVFNPEKKFLIRIVGLEGKIASIKQPMKTAANDKQILDALTNTSIIDMVNQKLSDGLIINIINRSSVDFNLSVDSMIYLSSQNVSSAVIMAMKNAMNSKISKESNKTNH